MTISTRGIRTPNDGDDWDLTLDLAAMAVTIDDAITAGLKSAAISAASTAERGTLFPTPVQGNRVWRYDLQREEAYFGTYNATTNPGGAKVAGWYPAAPGGIFGSVIRTGTTLNVANNAYTDLSTTAAWSAIGDNAQLSGGISFANGFSVSVAGIYKVSYSLNSSASVAAGVLVGSSSVTDYNLLRAASSGTIGLTSGSANIYVPASTSVKLFAAGLGSASTISTLGGPSFSLEWVSPARS